MNRFLLFLLFLELSFLFVLFSVKFYGVIRTWDFYLFKLYIYGSRSIFVKRFHLLVSYFGDGLENLEVVSGQRLTLDDSEVVLVLRKDFVVQELPCESVTMSFLYGNVVEVASLTVNHVVVTDDLATLLLLGDGNGALIVLTSPISVTEADEAFDDEVHFTYFLIFFIDYFVNGIFCHEPSR